MRIKTINAEETDKITCPICGKKLINGEGLMDQCKHVLLWSGTMADDENPLFAKNKKIANCYIHLYKQGHSKHQIIQTIYGNNPDVKIICFDEGYLGGCQYAKTWIAFSA